MSTMDPFRCSYVDLKSQAGEIKKIYMLRNVAIKALFANKVHYSFWFSGPQRLEDKIQGCNHPHTQS